MAPARARRRAPSGPRALRDLAFRRWIRSLVPVPVRRADLAAFRAIARARLPLAGRSLPWLSRAANHSRLWILIAAGLRLRGARREKRAALRGLLAVGLTSAVTNLPAKLLTARARPEIDAVPHIRRLAHVPTSTSFPSGHAASAFAFATAVTLERSALRRSVTALATVVAFSRITTGVHYPGDVLAGAVLGRTIARATTRAWPLIDPSPARGEIAGDARDLVGTDGEGLIVVANVAAGNVLDPEPRERLLARLPAARVLEIEPDDDLPAALRRAAGRARVLGVAGGDGSADAGAAVAAEAGIPLLVVPTGTLNHLAADLGIDGLDAAIRAVEHPRLVAMDLAEIDRQPYVNAAAVGVYPHLVAQRERLESRIGKWPAAAWSLLWNLTVLDPFVLEIDGRRRRIWLLFLGNGRFRSSGIAPTRRKRLDDGVLDVRLVHAERPWARTRMAVATLTGHPERSGVYERWLAPTVEVSMTDRPLLLARDGESWEGPSRTTARVLSGALLVLQPDPDAAP